jgi:hypothetical protein
VNRIAEERGSVLLLGIAFIGIVLLAIAVASDASALFRQHRALVAVADGAAIAGSQGLDIAAYYEHGAGQGTQLDPARVSGNVSHYLATAGSRIPGMTLERLTVASDVVRVELSAPMRLSFLPHFIDGPMRAQASARLDYRSVRNQP